VLLQEDRAELARQLITVVVQDLDDLNVLPALDHIGYRVTPSMDRRDQRLIRFEKRMDRGHEAIGGKLHTPEFVDHDHASSPFSTAHRRQGDMFERFYVDVITADRRPAGPVDVRDERFRTINVLRGAWAITPTMIWSGFTRRRLPTTVQEEQCSMYDVLVFDHRLAEYRPLDSKAELARLLFGYTTGNGQRFPAQPELVRFVVRPGRDSDDQTDLTGKEAIARAEHGEAIRFVYRAEGQRTEGLLVRIGTGHLRVR
jgi:hypothetical protein